MLKIRMSVKKVRAIKQKRCRTNVKRRAQITKTVNLLHSFFSFLIHISRFFQEEVSQHLKRQPKLSYNR